MLCGVTRVTRDVAVLLTIVSNKARKTFSRLTLYVFAWITVINVPEFVFEWRKSPAAVSSSIEITSVFDRKF